MIRRLSSALAGAAVIAALASLAACGADTGTSATEAADPAPSTASSTTSDPSADPTGTAGGTNADTEPQWPATCKPVTTSIDYVREPDGWKTPQEAVENSQAADVPQGTLVVARADATGSSGGQGIQAVWVIDDATGSVVASVSVFPGTTGFYVDGITTCA